MSLAGIIVTAAAENVPEALIEQLSVGGIMVIPVGKESWSQNIIRIHRTESGIETEKYYFRGYQIRTLGAQVAQGNRLSGSRFISKVPESVWGERKPWKAERRETKAEKVICAAIKLNAT